MTLLYILLVISMVVGFGALAMRPSFKAILKGTWGQGEPFDPVKERVDHYGNNIFIDNLRPELKRRDVEINTVFKLTGDIPEIIIYENTRVVAKYKIDPSKANPNINGLYLHSSIRVNANSGVQMDGIISSRADVYDKDKDEGIRFQPFMLSDAQSVNQNLKGEGMFARGLHYRGIITSGNTRLICLCDVCNESFSLSVVHAGFSELQYFYSSNSKEILFARYGEIEELPIQLQTEIDEDILLQVESQLPLSTDGQFKYYNPLKCPHCNAVYVDFKNKKEIRPAEYYAHYYLNTEPRYYS